MISFFQAEDGIRDYKVTGVQTCALPICGALVRRARSKHGLKRTEGVHDLATRTPFGIVTQFRLAAPERFRLVSEPCQAGRAGVAAVGRFALCGVEVERAEVGE